MSELVSQTNILQIIVLLLLYLHESHCSSLRNVVGFDLLETKNDALSPDISPSVDPLPFLPLLAPSPLMPFANNNSVPKLSGLCALNFSAAESILAITSIDCWASFAPYLANVACCPQFDATLAILIGQSSLYSQELALNLTHAKHCLSDVEAILESQGADENLHKMCSIYPSNLTEGSCPVIDVNKIDSFVNSSRLLTACGKIDPVSECCSPICQNALSDAARSITLKGYDISSLNEASFLPVHLSAIEDCKKIVLRWLARRLDPSSASSVLRGLSTCNMNKVCPLVFPDMRNISKECGNVMSNQKACCNSMESYVSQLQNQRFITNLQALNCAALLGMKLQKANVSSNVYNLCHINLKDFSLQVGSPGSGCLWPSLPSDAAYDATSGISFICDLNDNVAAPWPSNSSIPASVCNTTTKLPALPKATSAQSGLFIKELVFSQVFASLLILKLLL
ncbi:uncharacterized GPI-anchored protein At1g61900-like [Cornus florida]|uniref:uncharacterized GPI-anchored protein At1g61900-like n=1 Tax=Cornus florida TaxID=4283 RepID=UPI00289E5446|nr:uncharacterized GPI-anchored protein At1g61900-like [Cornus florida]